MRRVALGAAWLAATYLGTAAAAMIDSSAGRPWFVTDLIYFAPLAVLLVSLVRNLPWTAVIVLALGLLGLLEHLVRPWLNTVLTPLAPPPAIPPAPAVAHVTVWAVYYTCFALLVALVELIALWPFLKPAWMWPVYKVAAGPLTALALLWQTFLPVPGRPGAEWDWLAALPGAIALALLWRFEARAPRLRWPRPAHDEIDPFYAARIADLERSLEEPAT